MFTKSNYVKPDLELIRRIKKQWMETAPEGYWGDDLDVRYFSIHFLKEIKNKKILDVGCGPGIFLNEIGSTNMKIGIEISLPSLLKGQKLNPEQYFLNADLFSIPFKEESFDIIILNAMTPLIDEKEEFISSLNKLLKQNGELHVTTHNRNNLYYKYFRVNHTLLDYNSTCRLFEKHFKITAYGFNPFFLPNFLGRMIPFIWKILFYISQKKIFTSRCRGIFIKAIKQ